MRKVILLLTIVSLFTVSLFLAHRQSAKLEPITTVNDQSVKEEYAPADVTNLFKPAEKPAPVAAEKNSKKLSSKPAKAVPLNRKTEFTPDEMRQLELARKLERRKNGYAKSDSPDEYVKFQQLIRTREGTPTPEYEGNYKLTELGTARWAALARKGNLRTANLSWSERGPANVPGRTRGLLTHPDNPQRIWFAGSVAGGVWKTTDAGGNWVNKTPDLPNLATTVLAMAPTDPNVIYAGTGEGFFNADAVEGDGIFKSTDGGETWKQLPATAGKDEFKNINRIIVDPADANILLACSNTGSADVGAFSSWTLRSTDGGNSWSIVLALTTPIQQLVASPDDFDVQYAAVNGVGVYKSTDAGQTWELSNKGMYPSGRVEIAVAPTNPSRIYAAAQGAISSLGTDGSDLYVSDDAGANWQVVLEADTSFNVNWLGGQGWYDNTIMVHPYDQNIIYLGGIQLWKMTIRSGEGKTPQPVITSVNEVNTQSFLDFVNSGGQYFGGKLSLGNAADSAYVSVELRFGPGQQQKAHRFTVGGQGPGVPPAAYQYQDYVDVPFEVWDITNDRQLMVSFRDQQEDSVFNLVGSISLPDSTPLEQREYLYIHAIPYAEAPNDSVARNGGHVYNYQYFLWPILRQGATWNPDSLPDSKLVINNEVLTTRLRVTQNVSDSYNQFGGKNRYVHPDHHNLVPILVDSTAGTFQILNANDGGVYVSKPGTDPGVTQNDWIFAGNGYNTTQFYGADKKRDADEYLGGTQDNGTWRSQSLQQASAASSYLAQLGGDGFEVSWNYFNPTKLVGSIQFNSFYRSLNGGATWTSATNGYSDAGNNSPFISQIGTSQSNPDVLYTIGASGVWTSDNFGGNWKLTPIQSLWAYNGLVGDIKVSLANDQIIWAGHAISSAGRVHVSTNGGRNFTPASLYPDAVLGSISGLATHPSEDSTAYALFSIAKAPKILKTTDLGKTWTDISGFGSGEKSATGFPDVAVYTLLVMPYNPDIIWAGTEIGLVESTDGGNTWALAQNGLPAVSVWELKVVDDQVVVATHGRGIWSVTIPELKQEVVFVPYINDVRVATNGNLVVASSLRSPYDSTLVFANDQLLGRFDSTAVKDTLTQYAYSQSGSVTVQLKSYVDGEEYVSTAKTIEFFLAEAAYSYTNAFDTTTTDFFGPGFSVRKEPGFQTGAIHSVHPYQVNNDYTYRLKTPIIIADTNATFNYRDVVIVEPGEPGEPFGSPGFYDYVIVEGTKDGVTWKPLENGYNADYNPAWRTAYDNQLPGNDSLFVEHTVDMQKAFAPGDTVFFRFRLFSDPFATAWGWAVDDLAIQEDFKAVTSFTLVNAGTDVQALSNGDTFNLYSAGRRLDIRANTDPDSVGSVVFELNGKTFGTDNAAPYTLSGSQTWTPAVGTYTLKATPYAEANGAGIAGKPLTITFTVVRENEVVSLVLVNARTGQDIDTLQNGSVVDLSQIGRRLNIQANTAPIFVGSVVFALDGKKVRTENVFPYTLAGDNIIRYNSWTPPVGTHTLKATPYARFNAGGKVGIAAEVSFTVVDGSDSSDVARLPEKVVAYPNPGKGKFMIDLKAEESAEVTIHVYDVRGNQVYNQKASLLAGSTDVNVDISALPDGLYLLKALSDRQVFAPVQLVKQQ